MSTPNIAQTGPTAKTGDSMNDDHADRLLTLLGYIADSLTGIAVSLAEINRHLAPEAPAYRREISEFASFDWSTIGARVVKSDEFGASQIEWGDNVFTRRSPENKFDTAIWFSRPNGKDADGNVKYERLVTFRKLADAEPLSRGAEKAVATPVASPRTVAMPPTRPAAEPAPQARPEASDQSAIPTWDELPSASNNVAVPPIQPKTGNGPPPVGKPAAPDTDLKPGLGAAANGSLQCPNCGKSWLKANEACTNHVRPRIPGEPDQNAGAAVAGKKGQSFLPSNIGAGKVGADFKLWAKDFAAGYPHYQITRTGDTDMYHILSTVSALYGEKITITADNMAEVQKLLLAHAAKQETADASQ